MPPSHRKHVLVRGKEVLILGAAHNRIELIEKLAVEVVRIEGGLGIDQLTQQAPHHPCSTNPMGCWTCCC